jgi:Na+/proline symporter
MRILANSFAMGSGARRFKLLIYHGGAMYTQAVAITVFCTTLIATFLVAWLGRRHARHLEYAPLAYQKLNRWLIGLSAGAAANSGFVVTGAVGLGYLYGVQWLLLPLGWLLGDIVFWLIFPSRINQYGAKAQATTLTEIITYGTGNNLAARVLPMVCALIGLVCLGGYTVAQWFSSAKVLEGAFNFSGAWASLLFGATIIVYTAIGGFRGSVYTDSMQAVIRIVGTTIGIGTVAWFAATNVDTFQDNITNAGPLFLNPIGTLTAMGAVGFVVGYAAAALGFGLGQPQILSRYIAGASPSETQAAWWVYISFVQLTWVAMTLFGIVLRGVMPGIEDPETGFSLFFAKNMPGWVTGLIMADIFATLAATTNSLLVAMAQSVTRDLLKPILGSRVERVPLGGVALVIGAATMLTSFIVTGTVVSFALTSVSLMAAGVAPAVMIKVMSWRYTAWSLLLSVMFGFLSAATWRFSSIGGLINEAAIGIALGLFVNWVIVSLTRTNKILNVDRNSV